MCSKCHLSFHLRVCEYDSFDNIGFSFGIYAQPKPFSIECQQNEMKDKCAVKIFLIHFKSLFDCAVIYCIINACSSLKSFVEIHHLNRKWNYLCLVKRDRGKKIPIKSKINILCHSARPIRTHACAIRVIPARIKWKNNNKKIIIRRQFAVTLLFRQ